MLEVIGFCWTIYIIFSNKVKKLKKLSPMLLIFLWMYPCTLINFSLIETAEGSEQYVLSPAYDLLPVNANMPADKEQFALTMNGKKMNIRKGDFLKFADACGITRSTAEKLIQNLVKLTPQWLEMCEESLLPKELKERLEKIIRKRAETIGT